MFDFHVAPLATEHYIWYGTTFRHTLPHFRLWSHLDSSSRKNEHNYFLWTLATSLKALHQVKCPKYLWWWIYGWEREQSACSDHVLLPQQSKTISTANLPKRSSVGCAGIYATAEGCWGLEGNCFRWAHPDSKGNLSFCCTDHVKSLPDMWWVWGCSVQKIFIDFVEWNVDSLVTLEEGASQAQTIILVRSLQDWCRCDANKQHTSLLCKWGGAGAKCYPYRLRGQKIFYYFQYRRSTIY